MNKASQYDAKRRKLKTQDSVREERMTYDDYARMPDDGIRYELAGGRLEAMTPAPSPKHQLVLQELEDAVKKTCNQDYIIFIAPVDVILSDEEVRQPDLVLLHRTRLSLLTNRGIEGPPDLVAEVLSPASIKRDRKDKRESYARYGVSEYWIIDTNSAALEQYVLENGVYTLAQVYVGDDPVRYAHVSCVDFSMKAIMDAIPDIPDGV